MAEPLTIVSNRVPDLSGRRAGGLAVALRSVLRKRGGVWFGWNGQVLDETDTTPVVSELDGFELVTIGLSREDVEEYYHGAGNRILWPLFHNRADLIQIYSRFYDAYRRVNRRIAECLADLVPDGGTVWVQDFHLIPLGAELRSLGLRCRIGFFLHIPFPPYDLMRTLSWHEEIARWLAQYDLVGFQARRDLYNFHNYLERRFGAEIRGDQCRFEGLSCRTGVFPVTIDTRAWTSMANAPGFVTETDTMHRELNPPPYSIVGVERLDYTKGLLQRLLAVEELLVHHDRFRGKACLYQVVAPSRGEVPEYGHLRERLDAVSGRINSSYADFGWAPVHYLYRTFTQQELAALYRVCRVGLVTSLIDGMNLVAQEYVAAQNPEDPGVLVLSKFTGAAEMLDGAILVNPYDVEATSNALRDAFEMDASERMDRWKRMCDCLEQYDVHGWASRFLSELPAT